MSRPKKRVLVIDDEAGFTNLVKLHLERTNRYEVAEVNHSERSLSAARSFLPDLILLDVIMPGQDGGQVLAQLRQDNTLQHIPVIFLTATMSQAGVKARHDEIGGQPFLAKPIEPRQLIRRIETVLEQTESQGA